MERRYLVLFAASGALIGLLLAVILLLFWNLPGSRPPSSRNLHTYKDQSSAPRAADKSPRSSTDQRRKGADSKEAQDDQSQDGGRSQGGSESQDGGMTVSGGSDGNRPNRPEGSSAGPDNSHSRDTRKTGSGDGGGNRPNGPERDSPGPDKSNAPGGENGSSGLGGGNRAAAAAVRDAEKLRDQARRLAEKDQYGKAYETALEAWRKVQALAGTDPACQRLEAELRGLLEKYGEAANREYRERLSDDGKPLVIK